MTLPTAMSESEKIAIDHLNRLICIVLLIQRMNKDTNGNYLWSIRLIGDHGGVDNTVFSGLTYSQNVTKERVIITTTHNNIDTVKSDFETGLLEKSVRTKVYWNTVRDTF